MRVKIYKSDIHGCAHAPASKSLAHRLLIASYLAGNICDGALDCDDAAATKDCLVGLYDGCSLNVRESGSTLRFLLPIIGALGLKADIVGEGRLGLRPLKALTATLEAHGMRIKTPLDSCLPLHTEGKLCSGLYEIDATISSQYVTGLLFALPILQGDSRVRLMGKAASQSYIDITLKVLKDFGIEIARDADGFFIKGGQRYVAPNAYKIEGDWSSAGYLLGMGALSGDVTVKGICLDSAQGDKTVVKLLRYAGAKLECVDDGIRVYKSELNAIEFDAIDCPDVVPVMAATLSFAKGDSRIYGVHRLKDKESDRIRAIIDMLSSFGCGAEYEDGTLIIHGGAHHAGKTDPYGDHRIAMSAAVIAAATDGLSVIENAECVAKSYPRFWEDAKALGMRLEIEE